MLNVGDIVTIDRQPNIPLGTTGRVTVPDAYLGTPRLITAIDAVDGVRKYKFNSVMEEQPYWLEEDLTYISASKRPRFDIGDRVTAKDTHRVYIGGSDMIPALTIVKPDTSMTVVGIHKRWVECKYILKPDTQPNGQSVLLSSYESNLTLGGNYTLF